jgi:SpoVK/Ycf46/Vps4 family AAA+-type ATPase
MRRFPIKVKFLPPDERQRRALFDAALAALGVDERDDERSAVDRILVRAARLTPGDVAAVVEQVQILGGVESGLALAERLEREVSYKGGEKKMVGFG